MLGNGFSALDVFWRRMKEKRRKGEYGMGDEMQKDVLRLIRHLVWCVLASAHAACGQLWQSDMLRERELLM